jgi:hypothetical protein
VSNESSKRTLLLDISGIADRVKKPKRPGKDTASSRAVDSVTEEDTLKVQIGLLKKLAQATPSSRAGLEAETSPEELPGKIDEAKSKPAIRQELKVEKRSSLLSRLIMWLKRWLLSRKNRVFY